MSGTEQLRCAIVGETALPGLCAQILLEHGHSVSVVATDDEETRRSGERAGVSMIVPVKALPERLAHSPVDYLFSINNLSLLADEILALPARGAVNFHDGPLPSYAGLNAPTWGILEGATSWGVTWHIMTSGIDTGSILLEEPVDICSEDTSVSLNMKCFEAAIRSFGTLVQELSKGDLVGRQQDLPKRAYFAKWRRPTAVCSLFWSRPASELSAVVRALDFGVYPNWMGLPKVLLEDGVFTFAALDVLDHRTGVPPGTIVRIDTDSFTVATGTDDVRLTGTRTLEGHELTTEEVIARHGLLEGMRLPEPSDEEAEALTALGESLAHHESFWTSRLTRLPPLPLPGISPAPSAAVNGSGAVDADSAAIGRSTYDVPADARSAVNAVSPGHSGGDGIVAALVIFLGRLGGEAAVAVQYADASLVGQPPLAASLLAPTVPLRCELDPLESFGVAHAAVLHELAEIRTRGSYLRDLIVRIPELADTFPPPPVAIHQAGPSRLPVELPASLTLLVAEDGSSIEWLYHRERIGEDVIAAMRQHFDSFLRTASADVHQPVDRLSVMTAEELQQILLDWNSTAVDYPTEIGLHELIALQAARSPNRVAVVCQGRQITYGELCRRADRLARHLAALGVQPGRRVGVCLHRSIEMMICLLSVLKAGGAYVPLDPSYPQERIRFMIEDSQPVAVLCQRRVAAELLEGVEGLVPIDPDSPLIADTDDEAVASTVTGEDAAYVIYTSGSTGRPKGVMVSHRNVVNFFHGMDACIDHEDPGTFLAVTSISFDISVLELFWTLARGFRVILYTGSDLRQPSHAASRLPLDFSLFFFASHERDGARERYRLLTEAAKFADAREFSAVWTPERHFHAFGGLFPNASVTSAALAGMTGRVKLRAGSVVSPLHNPIRIAEEWAFVDNISNGRVGISFASGWQPDDFVLAPENFADRKQLMFRQIEMVQRLWRGESVAAPGPFGNDVEIQTVPRPIQPELPVWITAAGSPDTFRMAGESGFGLLTHLLGQSVSELGEKIAVYRDAISRANGRAHSGNVVLMLHTFVSPDNDRVRELVRAPMKQYLRSSMDLIKRAAWTFPTFKEATTTAEGNFTLDHLTPEEVDEVLDFSFERYFETSGLLGTPDKCLELLDEVRAVGVDEVACLIDFYDDTDAVLEHLPHLDEVRRWDKARSARFEDESIAALIERYCVTHLQCTPSLASMLVQSREERQALGTLKQLLVGGEAFPPALAAELTELVPGEVVNMYGPTETTIWSSTFRVHAADNAVPIGRPIANTQLYILDEARRPVAPGTPGELYIGGDGVTLGYLKRPELTDERFVTDPFSARPSARMYRTGDLARHRTDGNVEYLGRNDHQVKVRGYRIELGEIEAALGRHPEVGESVVVAAQQNGSGATDRLVAYVTACDGKVPSAASLRDHLKAALPEFMLPAHFEVLGRLPHTPNGKVDRNALPACGSSQTARSSQAASARDELERKLVSIWEAELGVRPIGIDENFFDLGGHSLLAMRVFGKLKLDMGIEVPLAAFLRAPTIEQLSAIIRESGFDLTEQPRSLVQIEAGASKPPLFCVHAHGGHVLFYKDLAQRVGLDRPFYALQARGVDGNLEPLTSFEEMAANYVREIRAVQPRGPYRLGGDCLGGVLALEMAQQLRAQGEETALVVMFDSFHPRYRPYLPRPIYELVHRTRLLLGFNLSNVRRLSQAERTAYVRSKTARAMYMLRYRLWDWRRRMGAGELRSDDPLIRTQAALDIGFDSYEPKPYDGRVVLFRSARQPVGIRHDPTLGWDGLIGELDVREMPSYFTTGIYEPNVGSAADELRARLDEIDRVVEARETKIETRRVAVTV